MFRQDTTNSKSQKVKAIPKDDVASIVLAATSVSMGSIGKSLAESTRTAGSLAEPSVVHPRDLEATGLPFEVPAPEGPTSAASLPDSSETAK